MSRSVWRLAAPSPAMRRGLRASTMAVLTGSPDNSPSRSSAETSTTMPCHSLSLCSIDRNGRGDPSKGRGGAVLFLQECVVRRIGHWLERAGRLAGAFEDAALGVEPLDGGHAGELAGAALGAGLQLQQRNVLGARGRRAGGHLAGD